MTTRFDKTSLLRAGNIRVPGYVIFCSSCSARDEIAATGRSGVLPPDVLKKKWKMKGWRVGRNSATCPNCNGKKEPPVTVKAEPPRQPTPNDKRRIFREIDENWDEVKGRYLADNTDKTISTRLGVPRAWVTEIREQAFGESQHNEEIDKALGDLKNLRGECERAMASAMDLAAKFEALSARIDAVAGRVGGLA